MELLSRSDAVRAGLKRFFTGTACSAGHVSERYVCDSKCCECIDDRQRARRQTEEFREKKNLREKERYWSRNKTQTRRQPRDPSVPRKKKKVPSTVWARAKRNASKRVRDALLLQISRNVGCDAQEFKKYMESKFSRGMTWENYGTAWEVDHIVPLAKFDLTTREGLAAASHYTNLQPLWTADNAEKSDSLPERHHPELPIGFSHSL